jgi:F0F1-type ATP synthase epsilon subunit
VTVLVDEARAFDQVDVAAARESLQAALDRQKSQSVESEAYAREQRIIDYANAQLRLTGHG